MEYIRMTQSITQSTDFNKDLVLIHGLYQNSLVMKLLGKRLSDHGYHIHYFEYPTLKKNLHDNIKILSSYLEQFSNPFSIIGHSLGCVLTLHTLQIKLPQQLQSVVAITPPFYGSRLVEYLAKHHSSFLVGKAENALIPEDKASTSWNLPIPLGVIAGTQNSGPSSLLLEEFTNTIKKNSLPSDGTVYLDETKISGLTDFITLPKSHTMILFDPKLALLCDHFIKNHHF